MGANIIILLPAACKFASSSPKTNILTLYGNRTCLHLATNIVHVAFSSTALRSLKDE